MATACSCPLSSAGKASIFAPLRKTSPLGSAAGFSDHISLLSWRIAHRRFQVSREKRAPLAPPNFTIQPCFTTLRRTFPPSASRCASCALNEVDSVALHARPLGPCPAGRALEPGIVPKRSRCEVVCACAAKRSRIEETVGASLGGEAFRGGERGAASFGPPLRVFPVPRECLRGSCRVDSWRWNVRGGGSSRPEAHARDDVPPLPLPTTGEVVSITRSSRSLGSTTPRPAPRIGIALPPRPSSECVRLRFISSSTLGGSCILWRRRRRRQRWRWRWRPWQVGGGGRWRW
mmetsp:Transcript_21490/g.49362  ORF Transcript_21490/g.49362 Transcript_21490/m.49362 type:complete len:290 (-) Transcript_21490:99-968(-)